MLWIIGLKNTHFPYLLHWIIPTYWKKYWKDIRKTCSNNTLVEISCLNLYESPSEISLKHFWFGLNHSIIPFSESLLLFGPLSHYSDRVKIDSDQQFMKIHCDSDIICNDSEAFRCSSEKFRKGSEAFSHESEILRSIQTWLRSIQTYLVMIQKQCCLIQKYLATILIYLVMIWQYSGTIQSEFRNFQLKFRKIKFSLNSEYFCTTRPPPSWAPSTGPT